VQRSFQGAWKQQLIQAREAHKWQKEKKVQADFGKCFG